VKNINQFLCVFTLFVFYCLAVNNGGNIPFNFDISYSSGQGEKPYFSGISNVLFCHTSQSETAVNNPSNFPVSTLKNSIKYFGAVGQATELLFKTEFSQYKTISGTLFIHFRKTDLIFPFHYFW
jgi:hypothetical protein